MPCRSSDVAEPASRTAGSGFMFDQTHTRMYDRCMRDSFMVDKEVS